MSSEAALRITEIFYSLQGESRTVGIPTVFVRLTGCPLRCVYCDSAYAFHGGNRMFVSDVLKEVAKTQARYVCVTGGEPLAQPDCHVLLRELCDQSYCVSLETSGAMPIDDVDARVEIVMDLKTPDSGEHDKNCYANVARLKRKDQVKFVVAGREDYEWARFKIDEFNLTERVGDVLLSPVFGQLEPRQLAEWILVDKLPVRFQIQMHKTLWGDVRGV